MNVKRPLHPLPEGKAASTSMAHQLAWNGGPDPQPETTPQASLLALHGALTATALGGWRGACPLLCSLR